MFINKSVEMGIEIVRYSEKKRKKQTEGSGREGRIEREKRREEERQRGDDDVVRIRWRTECVRTV